MIDSRLIRQFRSKVNDNSSFVLKFYKNRNGRNYWNLICSCMDWIDVSIDYIVNQDNKSDNINIKCMQAYSYITAIDIIWQSIQQLHRVFIDQKGIPFKGEKTVFPENEICNDDNEYFKHIRAVFGAHPVNLDRGGRWFASWPTDHVFHQYDYAVILYSADVNIKDMVFGYKVEELNYFLESRYEYLQVIIDAIESQYQNYRKLKANQKIKRSQDTVEQLKILKKESKERLDNDYYSYLIDDLLTLYQAKVTLDINQEQVGIYLEKCKVIVEELHMKLENMDLSDLENIGIIDLDYPNEIYYKLSQLYDCFEEDNNHYLYNHYFDSVRDFFIDFVTITSDMCSDEVLLLLKVGLYNYWLNTNKKDGY